MSETKKKRRTAIPRTTGEGPSWIAIIATGVFQVWPVTAVLLFLKLRAMWKNKRLDAYRACLNAMGDVPAVSLRRHQAPRGGDEILMAMDVFLQLCPLAGVSVFANLIQDNFRVGDSLPQEVIDDGCVPGQHGLLPVSPPGSTREHNEAVFLQPAEPLPGNAGSPAELREIDLFRVE